eukprot:TRINITY_DN8703_c0_g1_i1.p1 TRINITY_DN8703_c0_g1~~TRINITY_DN8703_c0_g1_i1.p1  ORF type:complete len:312 (-),score=72.74 TRINITY_DN8703_c0_g1_i1:13-948(-)
MMQEGANSAYGTTYGTGSASGDGGYYAAIAQDAQPLMSSDIYEGMERKPNFPICKPLVHHNITLDIVPDKRFFIRRAHVGWIYHCACLFLNFIVLAWSLFTKEEGVLGFVYAMCAFILGPPIAFCVYYLLYRAIRTASSFFFGLWMAMFVMQVLISGFFALGLTAYGAAGFITMIKSFSDGKTALGIMCSISTFAWIGNVIYSVTLFIQARRAFRELGGIQAASKEFAKKSFDTAYENRGAIKQVIVDNQDSIKQFAVENKDAVIDFAKEHRQEISQIAMDNKDTVARVAYDNRDTIWNNRDVVESVFDQR